MPGDLADVGAYKSDSDSSSQQEADFPPCVLARDAIRSGLSNVRFQKIPACADPAFVQNSENEFDLAWPGKVDPFPAISRVDRGNKMMSYATNANTSPAEGHGFVL